MEHKTSCFVFQVYLFILRQSVRVGERERERARERESQTGSVLLVQSLTWGLNSRTVRS